MNARWVTSIAGILTAALVLIYLAIHAILFANCPTPVFAWNANCVSPEGTLAVAGAVIALFAFIATIAILVVAFRTFGESRATTKLMKQSASALAETATQTEKTATELSEAVGILRETAQLSRDTARLIESDRRETQLVYQIQRLQQVADAVQTIARVQVSQPASGRSYQLGFAISHLRVAMTALTLISLPQTTVIANFRMPEQADQNPATPGEGTCRASLEEIRVAVGKLRADLEASASGVTDASAAEG